jgi:hypothetical protein
LWHVPAPSTGAKAALILPDGQITDFPVQPHLQKYSPSHRTQITGVFPRSHPTEGRIAIVTDAGWVRWTLDASGAMKVARTNGAAADGKDVWS